jgi:IS605 OrfB family transposase
MTISGHKDAKYGNFVFTYVSETKNLHFTTLSGVANLVFPYGQEDVEKVVQSQVNMPSNLKKEHGDAITWSVEDHGDYYIFKCILDLSANENINHSKSDGVLGVDLNVDHIVWSNMNVKGQLIKSGAVKFVLEGKSSGQATKMIEAEAIRLVDLVVKLNKSIVFEKLNTTKSKVSYAYGNKKANKKMSMFAYDRLISAIKNRANKMGVLAYTSKINCIKRFGISIHQAASYVIARRAMT